MPSLLDLAYGLGALLYTPLLLYQVIVQRKNRRGWRQRFGYVPPRVGTRPCIWVHGVSLGEINATRSLVAEIERRLPKYEVVVSATTQTGYDAAVAHYAPRPVIRFPLDFSWVVRRTLDRLRPAAIVLMELEVWPQLVAEAHARGIPVGIANGRLTEERSMKRFRVPLVRGVARRMFSRLAWIGAQDATYAARFAELGAARDAIVVTGSVKYDTALVADSVEGDEALARALDIDRARPLWVAGSTGPGEEAILLDAYDALRRAHPGLQLAVIPRKPERFDEVAQLIAARDCRCIRRSEHPDLTGQDARAAERERRRKAAAAPAANPSDPAPDATPTVILGDTMGELRKFYSLASVVFVGRTLVPMGGSDVMEVAGLGRPMVVGPHVENFADAVEKLRAAGGIVEVADGRALREQIAGLLSDRPRATAMGAAAREVVRVNVGATRKTVDRLCEVLGLRADHPPASIATARVEPQQSYSSSN